LIVNREFATFFMFLPPSGDRKQDSRELQFAGAECD